MGPLQYLNLKDYRVHQLTKHEINTKQINALSENIWQEYHQKQNTY